MKRLSFWNSFLCLYNIHSEDHNTPTDSMTYGTLRYRAFASLLAMQNNNTNTCNHVKYFISKGKTNAVMIYRIKLASYCLSFALQGMSI